MEDEQKPLSKTRFSVRVALWLKKKTIFLAVKIGPSTSRHFSLHQQNGVVTPADSKGK
jgi:hypothetical protein